MNAVKLSGLEPKAVLGYFEEICSIPHGSGNTKQISDYLVAFAKEHNLHYVQDELNNVILFGPGTCGYEDHEPVILQGHMDMVCEKDADCTIDMDTEGVDVAHDGEYIFAKGSTLGADNGIAIAYGLALLADPTIPHPPLEVVCTVDEETGMYGAEGIDLSCLKGRRMLNIDSGHEGSIIVSCAGGARADVTLPVTRRAVYGPCVRLTVEGLEGGHSGSDIHMNRANANKVMGEFLRRVQELMPICITKFKGGNKSNAIPRSCEVTLVALGIYIERINDIADQLQKEIREQFNEPYAIVRGDDVEALGGNALTTECTANVIALLNEIPCGVLEWVNEAKGQVKTSMNMGIVNLEENLQIVLSARSSVNKDKGKLMARMKEVVEAHNGQYDFAWECAAWEFKENSPLQDTLKDVYQRMHGKLPNILTIHGILECGALCAKIPGLDCVSIGPNMHDLHTSRERLEIASTKRTWDYILEILKAL